MNGTEQYLTCLQELVTLSEQATAAANDQNWDLLLACLDRRQAVMDQVDALPDSARPLTAQQALRATSLLERVAQLDTQSAASLDSAMTVTRVQLQEGSQTRAGISAYRRATASAPHMSESRFVDKNR